MQATPPTLVCLARPCLLSDMRVISQKEGSFTADEVYRGTRPSVRMGKLLLEALINGASRASS